MIAVVVVSKYRHNILFPQPCLLIQFDNLGTSTSVGLTAIALSISPVEISDGFWSMKRPPSGDARSAPARCVKQGGGALARTEESRAPSILYFGLDCEGTLAFGRLIFFYLFAYLHRLLARGIAMPLRSRHKPATAGIRSSSTAQARQASERRPTPLPDGRHTFLFAAYCSF